MLGLKLNYVSKRDHCTAVLYSIALYIVLVLFDTHDRAVKILHGLSSHYIVGIPETYLGHLDGCRYPGIT